jgi:hypothetical protein
MVKCLILRKTGSYSLEVSRQYTGIRKSTPNQYNTYGIRSHALTYYKSFFHQRSCVENEPFETQGTAFIKQVCDIPNVSRVIWALVAE